jgi:hypothetical protein
MLVKIIHLLVFLKALFLKTKKKGPVKTTETSIIKDAIEGEKTPK